MNFCTIITPDYIHYSLSLRNSLLQFHKTVSVYVLLSEFRAGLKEKIEQEYENVYVIYAEQICEKGIGKDIEEKYASTNTSVFRWSIKPVLMAYLMRSKGLDKIIYIDSDIYFYADYKFLFDELDESNVLVTPHWRTSNPLLDETHFISMYTSGLYNAGFVAVNNKAIEALEWWAKTNLFICENNALKGQFFDQTHLNLLHIYFEGVKSLKHRGCNVAGWNTLECRRTKETDGSITINNRWPIIFVHFSNHTIHGIQNGEDSFLEPHLAIYKNSIHQMAEKLGMVFSTEAAPSNPEQATPGRFANLMNKLSNKRGK